MYSPVFSVRLRARYLVQVGCASERPAALELEKQKQEDERGISFASETPLALARRAFPSPVTQSW